MHMSLMATTIKTRVGSINCAGLRTDQIKRNIIFNLAKQNKIDILLLQETNLRSHEEKKIKREWGRGPCIFSSSYNDHPASGVAILCSSHEFKILTLFLMQKKKYYQQISQSEGTKYTLLMCIYPHHPPSPHSSLQLQNYMLLCKASIPLLLGVISTLLKM